MSKWHLALVPACLLILVAAGTFQPFQGYGLIRIIEKLPGHYQHQAKQGVTGTRGI
jgi:hypothetical protein